MRKRNNPITMNNKELDEWLSTIDPSLLQALDGFMQDDRDLLVKKHIRRGKIKKINEKYD